MYSDAQRVVVTGIGAVTPVGNNVATTWSALVAGVSGIAPITRFDTSDIKTRVGGEVKDFDPGQFLDRREVRRLDRFLHFAAASSIEAVSDAGLDTSREDSWRVGVSVGSGIGGIETLLDQYEVLHQKGPRRVSPFAVPALMLNSAAAHVSMMFGARGPCLAFGTACATGNHSIGEAAEIIRRGDADVMIAGGSEAAFVPFAVVGFEMMGALTNCTDPKRASRPFDAERDGFVIAEGAGIVVLESLAHAKARGARMYAELAGYGTTADAFHVTAPAEDGAGAAESMRLAIRKAGLSPTDVQYINAHGTSTPLNDVTETRAVKAVFGEHAYRLALSSTKSMTGHLMGSAGAVEAIFTVLTLRDQILPPTINYETPDPNCDLDYVPNKARPAAVDIALSNSFGFGGHNATLVFRRLS